MADFVRCDKCRNTSEPYWRLAEWNYCRACVQKAVGMNTEPLVHPLVEVLHRSLLSHLVLSLWSAFVISSSLTMVIVVMFLAINLTYMLATIGQPHPGLHGLFLVTLMFAGFSFAFVSVVSVPLALIGGATTRAYRISMQDDQFLVETNFGPSGFIVGRG